MCTHVCEVAICTNTAKVVVLSLHSSSAVVFLLNVIDKLQPIQADIE